MQIVSDSLLIMLVTNKAQYVCPKHFVMAKSEFDMLYLCAVRGVMIFSFNTNVCHDLSMGKGGEV